MKKEPASFSNSRWRKIQITLASFLIIGILLVLSVIPSVLGGRDYGRITAKEPEEATTGPANRLGWQEAGAEENMKLYIEDPPTVANAVITVDARFVQGITYRTARV